jgi:hypothetical protein
MKRSKPGSEGKEKQEHIDVAPLLPPDPKKLATGAARPLEKEALAPGPEVEIENGLMNLSEHPRNEGYF